MKLTTITTALAFAVAILPDAVTATLTTYPRQDDGIQKFIQRDECEAKGEDVYTTTVMCQDPDDVIVGFSYESKYDEFTCVGDTYSITGPVERYFNDKDGFPSSVDAYNFSGVRLKCSNTGQYSRSTYIKTNVLCANPFDICGMENDRCFFLNQHDTRSVGANQDMEVKASCPYETTAWAIGLSCRNSNTGKFNFSGRKILNDGESWPSAAACKVHNKGILSQETTVETSVQCVWKDQWEKYTGGYL